MREPNFEKEQKTAAPQIYRAHFDKSNWHGELGVPLAPNFTDC